MNTLRKNKRYIWRCKYLGDEEKRDERGVIIGRFPNYSEPEKMFETISYSHNKNSSFFHKKVLWEDYGADLREDLVINTTKDTDITVGDVFFIGKEVSYDPNGIPEYNYVVSGVTVGEEFTLVSLTEVTK